MPEKERTEMRNLTIGLILGVDARRGDVDVGGTTGR